MSKNSNASVFPPALSRQFAMAAARSNDQGGDQMHPDDSARWSGLSCIVECDPD